MYKYKYEKYKNKYLKLKLKQGGGLDSSIISHPIKGPKKIIIVLKPMLLYHGNILSDSHLTGISNVDKEIEKRISNDYTKIQKILPFYYSGAFYWYHGVGEDKLLEKQVNIIITNYKFKNGLIYLTARKSNNNGFNKDDYKAIEISFDPDNFGPDGYMLQDIIIYKGSDLKPILKKYTKDEFGTPVQFDDNENSDLVELVVRVIDILPKFVNNNY
ncbi:MAG: hypothetical protein Satyrvirus8_30 [Satyrvirus sp.]|uniref:Uncharacterized protein n=1 Tax=Satyrvirus sp. TaxID=2487771 RepID=A0A3G5ADL6_9VIRU|nr:MAG: hypothetical protein Satyrvirus8_30 [Satyrvirus sp.]